MWVESKLFSISTNTHFGAMFTNNMHTYVLYMDSRVSVITKHVQRRIKTDRGKGVDRHYGLILNAEGKDKN